MFLRSRRGWLLSVALLAAGCLSPTLPLPPPSDPTVTSTSMEGLVRVTGTVEPQSEVFVLNHNSNLISGQHTDSGNYDFIMRAIENDAVTLWFVRGTVESPGLDFNIHIRQADAGSGGSSAGVAGASDASDAGNSGAAGESGAAPAP